MTGGKDGNFIPLLFQSRRVAVTGVYLSVIRQYQNLLSYGLDYLTEIGGRARVPRAPWENGVTGYQVPAEFKA